MDLLLCLASRAGETMSKEELLEAVWPEQFIVESGLSRSVAELRAALGDSTRDRYIETIPKRGYRLVAAVRDAVPAPSGNPITATAGEERVAASSPLPAWENEELERRPAGWSRLSGPARRRLAAAGAVLALSASGYAGWRFFRGPAVPEHGAVVPVVENATGDAAFDVVLPTALALQLEQSPYLRVVSAERVAEELRYMGRTPDQPVTRPVAREACRRLGARALIAASLTTIGTHYVVGLEGTNCETGESLARQQVEVGDREAVVAALGRAASAIRRRLGESVASIARSDVPIARATTGSLEALREFSLGERARSRGEDGEALRLYRRAVEIDPSFALAHARLGAQLLALRLEGAAAPAFERATKLADRASASERLSIAAYHAAWVSRDPIGALAPLEAWRDAAPDDPAARLSLAQMYAEAGRLEPALAQADQALRLAPDHAQAAAVRVEVLCRLGRFSQAATAGDRLVATRRDNAQAREILAAIAFVQGDVDAMRRQMEWAALTPTAAVGFLRAQAEMAWCEGKAATAADLWGQAGRRAGEAGDGLAAPRLAASTALYRALLGWREDIPARVEGAVATAREPVVLATAALALALSGRADAAEHLLDEYQRLPAVTSGSDPGLRACVRAAVALARERPADALDALAPLRPYDLGSRFGFLPAYLRGVAWLQSNDSRAARRQFEQILANRGVAPVSVTHALAWLGLARAAAAQGDTAASRRAAERLLELWRDADGDLPLLALARNPAARASGKPED